MGKLSPRPLPRLYRGRTWDQDRTATRRALDALAGEFALYPQVLMIRGVFATNGERHSLFSRKGNEVFTHLALGTVPRLFKSNYSVISWVVGWRRANQPRARD